MKYSIYSSTVLVSEKEGINLKLKRIPAQKSLTAKISEASGVNYIEKLNRHERSRN